MLGHADGEQDAATVSDQQRAASDVRCLLDRLWDSGGQFVDKHALAVNVNRLRAKLEDEQHRYISNVYGVGYQWIG